MSDAQENGVKCGVHVGCEKTSPKCVRVILERDHIAEMQKMEKASEEWKTCYRLSEEANDEKIKTIAELERVNAKLAKAIEESKAVWDAAYTDGFPEAMNEARAGNSRRLIDLLDRRLLFALAPLVDAELAALTKQPEPKEGV